MKFLTVLLLSALTFLSGCATPVYKEVFREKVSYNSKEFAVPRETLYQAVSRALCAKNFIIDKEEPDKGFIVAKHSFQRGKKTIILIIQAKMDSNGPDKTMLYLSALQTTERYYVADRTRFLLFFIPLPGGGGKEASQVKEGEEIVKDKTFYRNCFEAVDTELQQLCAVTKERGNAQ